MLCVCVGHSTEQRSDIRTARDEVRKQSDYELQVKSVEERKEAAIGPVAGRGARECGISSLLFRFMLSKNVIRESLPGWQPSKSQSKPLPLKIKFRCECERDLFGERSASFACFSLFFDYRA